MTQGTFIKIARGAGNKHLQRERERERDKVNSVKVQGTIKH